MVDVLRVGARRRSPRSPEAQPPQTVIAQSSDCALPVLLGESLFLPSALFLEEGLREPRDRRRSTQGFQGTGLRRPVEEAEETENRQLRPFSKRPSIGGDHAEGMAALRLAGPVEADLSSLADVSIVGSAQVVAEKSQGKGVALEFFDGNPHLAPPSDD